MEILDFEAGLIARWQKGTNYAELLNSKEEHIMGFMVSKNENPSWQEAEKGIREFMENYKALVKRNAEKYGD